MLNYYLGASIEILAFLHSLNVGTLQILYSFLDLENTWSRGSGLERERGNFW